MNLEDAKQLIAHALIDQKFKFLEDKTRIEYGNIRYEVRVKVDLDVIFASKIQVTSEMAINNDDYYYSSLYMQILTSIIQAGVAATVKNIEDMAYHGSRDRGDHFVAAGKVYRLGDSFKYGVSSFRITGFEGDFVKAMGLYHGALETHILLSDVITSITWTQENQVLSK